MYKQLVLTGLVFVVSILTCCGQSSEQIAELTVAVGTDTQIPTKTPIPISVVLPQSELVEPDYEMLSDDEKSRIWVEERYRLEVQNQLSKEQDAKSNFTKIWEFLNSSFGIWLLATVVVGSLSWAYTKWEKSREIEALFRSSISKLDIEINSRIQGIYDGLSDIPDGIDEFEFHHLIRAKKFNVYNEFKERSTRSLIIELNHMVPENQQPSFKKVLGGLTKLNKISPSAPYESGIMVTLETIDNAKNIIVSEIAIKRWPLLK